MIEFNCALCGASYDVDDDLSGKTIRCRECREYGRVPVKRQTPKRDALPPAPVSIDDLLRQKAEIEAKLCAAGYQEKTTPSEGPPGRETENQTVAQPRPEPNLAMSKAWLQGRFIFWALGFAFLLIAYIVNLHFDVADARQEKIDDAIHAFVVNTGGPTTYHATPKSDRTSVVLLTCFGFLTLGLGTVCWGIASTINVTASLNVRSNSG